MRINLALEEASRSFPDQLIRDARRVSVWFGKGDGTFNPGPAFASGAVSLTAADFNGDGFLFLGNLGTPSWGAPW